MAVAKVAVTWELPTELGLNIVIPSAPSPASAFLWLRVMCWNPGSDLLVIDESNYGEGKYISIPFSNTLMSTNAGSRKKMSQRFHKGTKGNRNGA